MPSAPLKTTLAGGPGKNALLDPAKKQYGERGAIAYLRPKLLDLTTAIKSYLKGRFEAHQFWALMVTIAFHIASVLALFIQIRTGVCVIWKIQAANSFALICFDYLLALALVLLAASSVLLSLVLGTWDNDESFLPGGEVLSFIILTLTLAVTFRLLSAEQTAPKEDILVATGWSMSQVRRLLIRLLYGEGVSFRVSWEHVWYGSLITSGLFLLGKKLLQYYLFEYIFDSDLYVQGGLLIVFLLWVYYCSQIFFLGAEFIQARMTRNEWVRRKPS